LFPQTTEDTFPASERARLSAIALQKQALRWGVEGLPASSAGAASAAENPGQVLAPDVSSYYQLRISLKIGGEL
jgi:hypothetical protein